MTLLFDYLLLPSLLFVAFLLLVSLSWRRSGAKFPRLYPGSPRPALEHSSASSSSRDNHQDNARLLEQIKMPDGETLLAAMHEYRRGASAFVSDRSAEAFMERFHDPIARFSRILRVPWSKGFGIAMATVKAM